MSLVNQMDMLVNLTTSNLPSTSIIKKIRRNLELASYGTLDEMRVSFFLIVQKISTFDHMEIPLRVGSSILILTNKLHGLTPSMRPLNLNDSNLLLETLSTQV